MSSPGAPLRGAAGLRVAACPGTLVDLGLVERRPDAEDRRAILLDATDEGRRRLEAMSRSRSDRFEQRLAGSSDAELAAFAGQLASYNSALSDD